MRGAKGPTEEGGPVPVSDADRESIVRSLDAAGVAIWAVDLKRGAARCSPRIRFLFGLPEDAPDWAPTEWYVDAVHPDDRAAVYAELGRAAETGAGFEVEFRARGADEQERWLISRGTTRRDEAGQPDRLEGAIIDITDGRRAEGALRESERRRELAIEAGGIGSWKIDIATLRLDADARFWRIFGGRDQPFGYERAFAIIHPEDREAVRRAVEAACRPEDPVPYSMEYRVVRDDGSVRWLSAKGRADFETGEGGALRASTLDGTVIDVTDRKQAEETAAEAQRQRRLYDTALSNTPDLVYVWGLDHRFIYANPSLLTMWGRTWDEAIGKNCLELGYEPWHAAMHDREIERVVATQETIRGVVPFEGTNGRRMYDYILVPVIGEDGRVEAVAGTTRDVTDRERLLAELEIERGKLQTFFQLAPAFIAVLRGRDLVFEYVNDAYYGIVGHRPIVGLPLAQALPEVVGGGEGRDYDRLLLEIMDSGEVRRFAERPAMIERTPGAPLEDGFLDLSYQPLREADGTITGVLVHGIDVTAQVRARRSISEREELFRTVFEQAPDDAIVVMDADRTVTAWNPAAERITGWSAWEMVGRSADVIFTSEDRAVAAPADEVERAGHFGKAEDERWHLRRDGTRFWGSGTMNSLHNAEGKVRGYLKVFRDATERYEETQALAFLSLLTEAIIDERDPDQIMVTAERMVGRYLGASRVAFAEVAPDGANFTIRREWAPDRPGLVGAHLFEEFGPVVGAELRAGRTHVSRDAVAESGSEGGVEVVRRYGIGSGVSVPVMVEGRLASVVVVHGEGPRDWTEDEIGLVRQVADRMSAEIERARAEEALRASEGRFRQLVDLSPSTVWTAEPGGGLTYISRDFYDATGMTPEMALPNGWATTIHPDDLARVVLEWEAARREETLYDTEFRIRHLDGAYRWISARALPLREGDGRVTGWLGNNSDIQAQKETEETLKAMVDARTEELQRTVREAEGFNYSISHDLRTPLRAMVSTASILLEELGPELDEEYRGLLVRQAENAKRMGRLIDELLRLSRLARVEVRREPLDMTAKALSVFEELSQHGATNGCGIEVQPEMAADGDSGLVRTVLQNLLGNACKFSPDGGTVRVREEAGAFAVSDEGVGFDMAFAPKVFLPFERLVSESEFPGTGIGLANVKRIVERHGGRVWVESAPGKGTTFWFTLGA